MKPKWRPLKISVPLIIFLMLSSFLVSAVAKDTTVTCVTNQDCYDSPDTGDSCATPSDDCSCLNKTKTCWTGLKGDPTSNQQITTPTPTTTTASPTINQSALDDLKKTIDSLQTQSVTADEKIATLESSIVLVQQQLTELTTSLNTVSTQLAEQTQSKEALQKDVTSVATGLAGLQTDVGSAKKDLKTVESDVASIQTFKLIVTIVGLLLISAGILLGLQFYLKTKKADPRLVQYVLKQAQQGKRFAQVQPVLLKAGWTDDDIKEAYREAMKKGSLGASGTAGPGGFAPSGMDSKKVIFLAGFALFFVIGIILVLKGVTTGHAIFFKTPGELSTAMKTNIEKNLETNLFYNKIKVADLCVEVEEGDNSASYRIIKSKKGNKIQEATVNCDNTDNNGFAVKFKSWEAFDLVSNDLTCANIKTLHNKKLMYVLPSKVIKKGFTLDETTDITPYCAVLTECLTAAQLKDAGIDC